MAESDIGGGGMPQPLKKNLGPLPVWAWGVILGALIAAYIWFGQSRSDNADEASDTPDQGKGLGDAIDGAFRIGGSFRNIFHYKKRILYWSSISKIRSRLITTN